MLSKKKTRTTKKEGIRMINSRTNKELPGYVCSKCGKHKANSSSNMAYLCGKCYLKYRRKVREKKGLK